MDTPAKPAKFEVTLIAPAKIDGVREPKGKAVWVTPMVASQLFDAGAVPGVEGEVQIGDEVDVAFEALVSARAEEIANAIVAAAVETALAGLTAEKDKALAQAEAANARAEEADQRSHGFAQAAENADVRIKALEAELAQVRTAAGAETQTEQDTPPIVGAKTTRKGAAQPKKS
ncbi:hypothetical protein [Puniceibacterium sp. IMCC21224]|uniref:hypothetical protein n=1 Tax=Puniceibacterium sp. IMCC21224 TaxID=1618204 RepID=UPI00064DE9DF|nr:hypothetical protein [Puniceibacterium sp. IMCC21224]KMK68575.1 hypothetical protein IMCC21224_113458 [Puniceibacterium sp. IMCC21224]